MEPTDAGTRDALGNLARRVQVPWECHRTGDCCRSLSGVTVTPDERALLEAHHAAAVRPLEFVVHPKEQEIIDSRRKAGEMAPYTPKFYQLTARPCPFLSSQGICTVHDVRPYNCRRFMCGRVDVHSESFEEGGPMGCHNLSDRVNTSLRFQEFYVANERRAQKDWALKHGWDRKQQ